MIPICTLNHQSIVRGTSIKNSQEQRAIWSSFARALGAEARPDASIRGVSGIEHHVQSILVDDKTSRVILVSAEPTSRSAALMQVDVQATLPNAKVLVARPIIFDIGDIARKTLGKLPFTSIDAKTFHGFLGRLNEKQEGDSKIFEDFAGSAISPIQNALAKVELPTITQILDVVNQASQLPWQEIMEIFPGEQSTSILSFDQFTSIDNLAQDRSKGVCPVPLYELTEQDWNALIAPNEEDFVRERLKELGIYQYFFPALDHVSVGLVEQGLSDGAALCNIITKSETLGHPAGVNELISDNLSPMEIIAALEGVGYIAEGEFGYELSETGKTVRSIVRFRPRESFITKLLNRFNLEVSIDPLKGFGGS